MANDKSVQREIALSLDNLRAPGPVRSLIERLPAIIYLDAIGSVADTLYMSPQVEALFGFTSEEWIADPDIWERQLHPDDRVAMVGLSTKTDASGEPFRAEYRIHAKDGRLLWCHEESTLIKDDDGNSLYWQGIIVDITERKNAEEQLRKAETRYRAVIEQVPAITYVDPIDENAFSIYVSPQVEQILGCTPDQWVSDPSWWHNHVHPDDEPRVWATYTRHRESGKPLSQDYRMVRDDGKLVWIHEQASTLQDAKGEPILIQGMMHDITARKEAEEQVAFLAYHDKLTGLANRSLLEEMLEPALARARRQNMSVAMLFMDLDNLKEVNDTFGHEAGDELLRQVAERLTQAARETDLVARQGGDEFLIMLADLQRDPGRTGGARDKAAIVAEMMAERIHKLMRAPFSVSDSELHCSISIGVSVFPIDAIDARALLKNADAAMYESKKASPGGYKIYEQTSVDSTSPL